MNLPQEQERLAVLERQMIELRADIKGLVEAWNAATGLVKFVKFLSTLVAAVSAVYLFLKHGVGK